MGSVWLLWLSALGCCLAAPASAQLAVGPYRRRQLRHPDRQRRRRDRRRLRDRRCRWRVRQHLPRARFSAEGQLLFMARASIRQRRVRRGAGVHRDAHAPQGLLREAEHLRRAGHQLGGQLQRRRRQHRRQVRQFATGLWSGIAGAGHPVRQAGREAHYQSGFSDTFEDMDASYGVWSLMSGWQFSGAAECSAV